MIKTNIGLVDWCKSKLGAGYVYGTYFAQPITEALIQAKAKQYPDRYTSAYIAQSRKWIGKEAGDCVGLIKGYYWHDGTRVVYKLDGRADTSANGMLSRATEKGPISTMPQIPGICLHKDGHIGVYIGGGYAIESRGVAYGVVKTAVSGRGWTSWLKCPYIDYSGEGDIMLQKGDKGLSVTYWQKALLKWKPDCLPRFGADSDFGGETETGTKQFQASAGLEQTGIVNTATFAYMCNVLIGLAVTVEVPTGISQAELDAAKAELARANEAIHQGASLASQQAQKISELNADKKAVAAHIDAVIKFAHQNII